jgi:hypothetical protein
LRRSGGVTASTVAGSATTPAAIVGSPVKTATSPRNVLARHCVMVGPVHPPVDDVDGPGPDDEQRRVALALLEQGYAGGCRVFGSDPSQLREMGPAQPSELGRVVRVEVVLRPRDP